MTKKDTLTAGGCPFARFFARFAPGSHAQYHAKRELTAGDLIKNALTTRHSPFSVEAIQDPYLRHRLLRQEHGRDGKPARMVWNYDPSWARGFWEVLDSELIRRIAKNHEAFSSEPSVSGAYVPPLTATARPLIAMDGSIHVDKKKSVTSAFRTDQVEEWEPVAKEIVIGQLEAIHKRSTGTFEAMSDLAIPIPIKVICAVLGIDYNDQSVQEVRDLTYDAVAFLGGDGGRFIDRKDYFYETRQAALLSFVQREIDTKRATPDDTLLSKIVKMKDGVKTGTPDLGIIVDISLLLFAGNVTTTNLIGQCFRYLAQYPETQQRVRKDYKLLIPFIEEILRLESPAQGSYRAATTDIEIDGVPIKAGELVYLNWGAAGRDPRKYVNPERFDLDREDKKHDSFGYGKHFCIGDKLARMEAKVTLEETLRQTSDISFSEGHSIETVKYLDLAIFRGPEQVMLQYTR